ncbi:MAG: 30S ribosomal protein S4 [Nitrospirae bacterium]|nr:MAG: 30S ribosomal protein S4 [Nitrospirota bacterium]
MARYTGPVCKICRSLGMKLFFKGNRCYTDKCGFERRPFIAGPKGARRRKVSDYGLQLKEKQKVRKSYGVMEKQFRIYFKRAERMKGATGENLLKLLEMRLDNVVYQLGFASSRRQARQLVTHGHFMVNGKKRNIPSSLLSEGDVIELREKSRSNQLILDNLSAAEHRTIPSWLELDAENFKGRVLRLPEREDITLPIEEQLIVELYSK